MKGDLYDSSHICVIMGLYRGCSIINDIMSGLEAGTRLHEVTRCGYFWGKTFELASSILSFAAMFEAII